MPLQPKFETKIMNLISFFLNKTQVFILLAYVFYWCTFQLIVGFLVNNILVSMNTLIQIMYWHESFCQRNGDSLLNIIFWINIRFVYIHVIVSAYLYIPLKNWLLTIILHTWTILYIRNKILILNRVWAPF